MRSLLFLFLVIFSINPLSSQSLSHVQGELLIQIDDNKTLDLLKQKYGIPSMTFTEVTKIPMKIWKVSFDFTSVNEYELLRNFKNDSKILKAQFNHILKDRLIPDDPQFGQQWQYMQILNPSGVEDVDLDAEEAWDVATGGLTPEGDTIVVCVIDDGIDFDHEDFGDNIWRNHAEIPGNNIDDDNNGYIDDVYGWNTDNDNPIIDQDGSHGTPVAGIIGAQGNNAIGVTGVNWDVKLMIVVGGGNEADALAAYAYPYYFRKLYNETNGAEGAFVVSTNASWGIDYGNPEDAPIWCGFYDSLGEEGILSCGATANIGIDIDIEGDLPTGCSSDFLISVTNMNMNDDKVNGAAWGLETIDLGAFGSDTWTTGGNNNYRAFGGTSGATPHVTGTIALLYSAPCTDLIAYAKDEPGAAALLIKDYILTGVEPNESLEGITVTGGRLNMNNAIQNLMAQCTGCPLVSNINFTNVDLDGFNVEWEQSVENTKLNMRYRVVGDEDWTTVENAVSPFELSTVEYCSNYEFEFQTFCDDIENSFFGNHKFTTEGCCTLMSEDEISLVYESDISAEIFIPQVLVAQYYTLEFRQTGDTEWQELVANDMGQYIFTETEECKSIEFRLQVNCGDMSSDFYEYRNFYFNCSECLEIEYCDGMNVETGFEWIEQVQFGDELAVTGPSSTGYQNNIGVNSFLFKREEIVDFVLTPGFENQTYDEYFQIWIDYDKDGEFNDSNEFVYQSPSATDSVNVGAFIIPEDAPLGITRMRIVMSFDDPTFSCGDPDFEYGETEDYCVEIAGASSIKSNVDIDISLYPNPAHQFLEAKNLFYEGQVSIYDLNGREILSQPILPKNSYKIELPESMSNGLYLFVYEADGKSWNKKFIKH